MICSSFCIFSYKRLLPKGHRDSAAVADVWPSTSAFDGFLSALSPLQAIWVEHCERVHLITAARRICIANCRECVFFLGLINNPSLSMTIINCRWLHNPYNAHYSQLEEHMNQVGVDPNINRWDESITLGVVDPHDSLSHPAGVSDVQAESATRVDPDQFTDLVIPNWLEGEQPGSTKDNPFPLPDAYLASQKKKYASNTLMAFAFDGIRAGLVRSNSCRFKPSQADEEAHQLSYLQKHIGNILSLLADSTEGEGDESLVLSMDKFEHLGFLMFFGEKGSAKTPLSQSTPFFTNSDPDMDRSAPAQEHISDRVSPKENGPRMFKWLILALLP